MRIYVAKCHFKQHKHMPQPLDVLVQWLGVTPPPFHLLLLPTPLTFFPPTKGNHLLPPTLSFGSCARYSTLKNGPNIEIGPLLLRPNLRLAWSANARLGPLSSCGLTLEAPTKKTLGPLSTCVFRTHSRPSKALRGT